MRLDHAQHHLHRDRRIDRRAAAAQHVEACLDRQRMGGGNHLLRFRARAALSADNRQQQGEREQPPHARRATMNRRRKGKSVMPSARVG